MGRTTRTIERLRLRADSAAAVRHAVPLIEDAFRTATLPDDGARLVFVKRLNLGRMPVGASAQSLSLLLESRFRESDWRLVPARDASSDESQAVWFRDALDVHELAALRIVRGQPIDAWFWPLAIPALVKATTPDARVRAIALSLAAQEEAPAALPAWVTTLVRAGYRDRLIAALHPGDGRTLLRAAGLGESAARLDDGRVRAALRGQGTGIPQSTSAAADDRVEFVERVLGFSGDPAVAALSRSVTTKEIGMRASDPRDQPGSAAEAPSRSHRRPVNRRKPLETNAATPPAATLARTELHETIVQQDHPRKRASARASAPAHRPGALEIDDHDGDRVKGAGVPAAASLWALPETVATAAGGLLFLIPVLDRVGFAEWCAKTDAVSARVLARQIFGLLLARLRIPDDDPAWELVRLRAGMPARAPADRLFGSACLAEALKGPSAEAGLTACRRLLRRRVRIGLATLVVRPAKLAVTATHVDVFFPLTAADIRIRRAGLDVDPGWVPWFARVVTFHYQDSPWT